MQNTSVKHPAVFSDPILNAIREYLPDFLPHGSRICDPFAGTGKIHNLRPEYETWGIEIEEEWASMSEFTRHGTVLDPPFSRKKIFDGIVTSPCYGNRMADHFNAQDESKRVTYRHYLGRPLTEGSAGKLQWGGKYREFHYSAWKTILEYVKDNALFVLNISNHVRKGEVAPVVEWHCDTLMSLGWEMKESLPIPTQRMGFGQNYESRVEEEWVFFFTRG